MKADAQTQAWAMLVLAGLLEVGFTTAMTLETRGHRWASGMFYVCVIASFLALQEATRTIPLGIGYAVWTGIGAAGTLAVSTFIFRTPIAPAQIAFVIVLIGAVVGLKLTSPHP